MHFVFVRYSSLQPTFVASFVRCNEKHATLTPLILTSRMNNSSMIRLRSRINYATKKAVRIHESSQRNSCIDRAVSSEPPPEAATVDGELQVKTKSANTSGDQHPVAFRSGSYTGSESRPDPGRDAERILNPDHEIPKFSIAFI